MRHKSLKDGFGLVELLATLTVGAILLAVAIPNFQNFIQNNRAVSLTNDFVTAVNYARTEAVKRAANVTICPSANAQGTACSGTVQWENGWIVFVDINNDGQIADASERLLVQQPLATGSQVNTTVARITFEDTGFVSTGAGSVTLAAHGCYGQHARTLTLGNTGHITVNATSCETS